MNCNLCGKSLNECNGWLERVNPKGQAGVFECRPSCNADLPLETRVVGAIEALAAALTEHKENQG